MKKLCTSIILIIFCLNVFSQQNTYSKIYFDQNNAFTGLSFTNSFDGGLVVCGNYNYGCAILKTDSLGSIEWTRQIGGNNNNSFNSIIRTTDSCYFLAGKTIDPLLGTQSIYFLKINQSGNVIWEKLINELSSEEAFSVIQTYDGGYAMIGIEYYTGAPNSGICVIKVDSAGDLQWHHVYTYGNNSNTGLSIKELPDSGLAIVGYVENYPPYDGNGLLCKLNSSGSVEWARKYNVASSLYFSGCDMAILPDGIISYYNTTSGYHIVKTDFNGNYQWSEAISGIATGSNCLNCVSPKIKLLHNGNLVFATGTPQFNMPSAVICIESTGNFNWAQYCDNNVHDILEADDYGLFLLGNGPLMGVRTSTLFNPHVGIIKTDTLGNGALCTTPNPFINISFGSIVESPISLVVSSHTTAPIVLSNLMNPINLSERSSCVDMTGGIGTLAPGKINIYPNPTTNSVNIDLTGLKGSLKISIQDMLGREVLEEEFTSNNLNQYLLDYDLAKGVYLISLTSYNKKLTGKLIVE